MDAAKARSPGLEVASASKEAENGDVVYDLELTDTTCGKSESIETWICRTRAALGHDAEADGTIAKVLRRYSVGALFARLAHGGSAAS